MYRWVAGWFLEFLGVVSAMWVGVAMVWGDPTASRFLQIVGVSLLVWSLAVVVKVLVINSEPGVRSATLIYMFGPLIALAGEQARLWPGVVDWGNTDLGWGYLAFFSCWMVTAPIWYLAVRVSSVVHSWPNRGLATSVSYLLILFWLFGVIVGCIEAYLGVVWKNLLQIAHAFAVVWVSGRLLKMSTSSAGVSFGKKSGR